MSHRTSLNEGLTLYADHTFNPSSTSANEKPVKYDKPPASVLEELKRGPVMASTVGLASEVMLGHRESRRSTSTLDLYANAT
ncbi:hypothetical protein HK104_003132, partial [Borealophlyctis nickersoniae]